MTPFRRVLCAGLLAVVGTPLSAACDPTSVQRPDDRYESASVDGQQVRDRATGLVWRRCALGQSWNGNTCQGTPTVVTWAAAVAAGREGWRLPTHRELLSLIDGRCFDPAVNPRWFPATPGGIFWSGTSNPQDSEVLAWTIDFFDGGYKGAGLKNESHYVRLVRPGTAR